ncbi:sulfite exporter TauE/SafE family protein [Desulfovibrio litoralis]|uniref:Probable membrane transporter protein n=1 Tax=Desulfovibrio litoralis DSM 11393 TaxID=1121455 RepID=A0A1M7TN89_9BACT|nr:sulfite exporter TauE/SafE family protein [Desulfovibrio litoralis]SHN72128.1 Uncharacterized membrane protein YfcA [Desulfovibrio litoralis DSM 11393]
MLFLTSLAIFLFCGAFAGILAGLFGVGGGIVIVPLVSMVLVSQGVTPDHIMHIAIGTSLASIMFTSISSFMSHHKRGAVLWSLVFTIAPGILIGTLLGSYIASYLSPTFLKTFFAIFLLYVATQMLLNFKPKGERTLPKMIGTSLIGGLIGVVSSLVGIGGGTLSVPFMLWCNIPMPKAVGTSAAIGFPIAVSGALGYVLTGLSVSDLPPYSFGYVYIPALLGLVATSMLTAPIGVKLAHSLPVPKLKKMFSILLYIMAIKMLFF